MRADAPLAELAPLIGYRHGQIVHAVLLQRTRQLDRPDAIAIGLDHADQGMSWGQEAAVVIEVGDDGAEVDIQHRLVHVRREAAVEALEGKAPRPLEQQADARELLQHARAQQRLRIGIAGAGDEVEALHLPATTRPDEVELLDLVVLEVAGDLAVELLIAQPTALYIGEDEHAAHPRAIGTATQEVQRYRQALQVAAVVVIDQRAAPRAFLDLEAHAHGA